MYYSKQLGKIISPYIQEQIYMINDWLEPPQTTKQKLLLKL
jgi:hypothetical protein